MTASKSTALLAVLTVAAGASAAAITPGDLVVYRIGDGSQTLGNTGNSVFVDEYSPTGTLVQSIALPGNATAGNNLIASGTASSEGALTVSADGKYVALTGYNRALGGTTSLSGTASTSVARTVGVITASTGAVDTSTALTDYASANNPRTASTADGTNIYVAGGAGGVRYATLGSTTSTQLNTDVLNVRQIGVVGGQLYASSSSGTNTFKGINTIGTGTPTTSGQTATRLPGLTDTTNPSSYAFVFADLSTAVAGVDTLYVADDSVGLQKFSLVNGAWVANGSVGSAAAAYRGLTASVVNGTVNLYAVGNGTNIVGLSDASGYNAALTGTPTTIATAGTGTAFRGIGYVAAAVPEPTSLAAAGLLAAFGLRRRRA